VFGLIPYFSDKNVLDVTVGPNYVLAYAKIGTAHAQIYAWGANQFSLGFPANRSFATPQQLPRNRNPADKSWSGFSAGSRHCVIWSTTTVWGYGSGPGVSNSVFSQQPFVLFTASTGDSIQGALAGIDTTFIWTTSGKVYSFGRNTYGELGLGDTQNRSSPVLVQALQDFGVNVTRMAHKSYHTLFMTNTGFVYSAGLNSNGQLGINSTVNQLTPVLIPNLQFINYLQVGKYHSIVWWTRPNRPQQVFVFGSNDDGQLGLGDTVDRLQPTLLFNNQFLVSKVDGGDAFTLVKQG